MQKVKTVLTLLSMVLTAACSTSGDEYIGTWSNQYMGGNYRFTIERNNTNFLFTGKIASNGAVVTRNSAMLVNGNLIVENEPLFGKLAYSKKDDSVFPLNTSQALPAFKRVK